MKKEITSPATPTRYVSITGSGNVCCTNINGSVTINDTAIVLRLLSIIEAQGKQIARLYDEIITLRLSAIQNKISHEHETNSNNFRE